jgi:transcriptional regulator with XRE-family HTH domain
MFIDMDGMPWYKKIKLLRVGNDLSQQALAAKCGTTQKQIWLWESGSNYPSPVNRKVLAVALGVSQEFIFGSQTSMDKKVI